MTTAVLLLQAAQLSASRAAAPPHLAALLYKPGHNCNKLIQDVNFIPIGRVEAPKPTSCCEQRETSGAAYPRSVSKRSRVT